MRNDCSFLLVREPGERVVFYEINAHGKKGKVFVQPFAGPGGEFGIQRKRTGDGAWREVRAAFHIEELTECEHIANTSREDYLRLVQKALDQFDAHDFDKVVTSRKEVVPTTLNPIEWFKKLDNTYPKATILWLYLPGVTSWMAATPETLLKSEGMEFETMSLAGTRLTNTSKAWGDKELEEQNIVTHEIEQNLRDFGARSIQIGSVYTQQAGPVEHICTRINGLLPFHSDSRDMAKVLHPTPAVCGRSRQRALDFILNNEGYERGLYAGFIGWQENNTSTFYVHLRCMQIFQKHVALYAGGGITAKSIPEDEWLETERKLSTLKSIIEPQA